MMTFQKIKEQFPPWYAVLIVCFVLFFVSNKVTVDDRPPCVPGNCAQLYSSLFPNDDRSFNSETYVFLAPSTLMLPFTLRHLEYEAIVDPSSDFYITQIHYDLKDNQKVNQLELYRNDTNALRQSRILIKAMVLLSLPYWLFILWAWKRSKIAKVILIALLGVWFYLLIRVAVGY